jgi:hypothetical protein
MTVILDDPIINELEDLFTYLDAKEVEQVTDSTPKTVRSWRSKDTAPMGVKLERLGELNAITQRLARLMKPDFIRVWLRTPVPLLDDEKPIELLTRGEYKKVSKLIANLESPGIS